ncbi:MAG: hypothetical protein KQH63_20215 [Desulfobulbaceae bacterium]|nr:hypothetical protein [Desulfobulbaceae bacterium]
MNNQEKAGFAFFALTVIATLVWLFVFPGDVEKGKTSASPDSVSPGSTTSLAQPPSEGDAPPASRPPKINPQKKSPVAGKTAAQKEKKNKLVLKPGAPPLPATLRKSLQPITPVSQSPSSTVQNSKINTRKETITAKGELSALPYDQLHEIIAATLKIINPEERKQQLRELGSMLAKDDTSVSFDILEQMENQEDMQTFVSAFLPALYAEVPGEALDWVGQITDEKLSLFSHNLIASQWVEQDIQAAYEWALQLEDSHARHEVLEVIGKTLAKEDPQSAMEWALQFDDETVRAKLVANTIATWSVQDMIGLANWTIRLPETEENNVIIARQFNLWTQFSPDKASQWAVKIDDHDLMTKAVTTVARFWARSNSKQAADWLLATNQIDSEKQIAALSSIVTDWAKQDPTATGNWVATVTDPEVKKILSPIIDGLAKSPETHHPPM